MRKAIAIVRSEAGHAQAAAVTLVPLAGAVVLGIGAAADSGVTAIIGGIVLGLGIVATSVADHMGIDYDIYRRLEDLEKK